MGPHQGLIPDHANQRTDTLAIGRRQWVLEKTLDTGKCRGPLKRDYVALFCLKVCFRASTREAATASVEFDFYFAGVILESNLEFVYTAPLW